MKNKLLAEFFGTFWLVFGGCGSAVLAAKSFTIEGSTPINLGIGLVAVSFAFGLTLLTMAFAIGHVSGCHLNPAVSVGLLVGGRFKAAELAPYILSSPGRRKKRPADGLVYHDKDGWAVARQTEGAGHSNRWTACSCSLPAPGSPRRVAKSFCPPPIARPLY